MNPSACPIVVVMGVSGCGKSTIGRVLVARLDWGYRDGDEFHSPANIEKMRAGKALDDADRASWLAAIARWMDARSREGVPAVVACSALKRRYRDFLRGNRRQAWFLYLRVPRSELKRRLQTRHHPYMPASLLDSQLRALEEPDSQEPRTITLDAADDVKAVVESALRELRAHGLRPATSTPNGGSSKWVGLTPDLIRGRPTAFMRDDVGLPADYVRRQPNLRQPHASCTSSASANVSNIMKAVAS